MLCISIIVRRGGSQGLHPHRRQFIRWATLFILPRFYHEKATHIPTPDDVRYMDGRLNDSTRSAALSYLHP